MFPDFLVKTDIQEERKYVIDIIWIKVPKLYHYKDKESLLSDFLIFNWGYIGYFERFGICAYSFPPSSFEHSLLTFKEFYKKYSQQKLWE